jgi:hypothetical protein
MSAGREVPGRVLAVKGAPRRRPRFTWRWLAGRVLAVTLHGTAGACIVHPQAGRAGTTTTDLNGGTA